MSTNESRRTSRIVSGHKSNQRVPPQPSTTLTTTAPLARRPTTGPLDLEEDPLSGSRPETPLKDSKTSVQSSTSSSTPPVRPVRPVPTEIDPKKFPHLFRSEVYHRLSDSDVPQPFRQVSAKSSLSTSTPLPSLLSSGHFRLAAQSTASKLSSKNPPTSAAEIFHLFYVRLACLCLLNLTHLAAKESTALGDINARTYRHPSTGESLLPWSLRVQVTRLQGLGYGDLRREIMGFYDLARECRSMIVIAKKSGDEDELNLWKERLEDLGVRVAAALAESGDLLAAARHLQTLRADGNDEMLRARLLLLWLRIGDVRAAKECVGEARAEMNEPYLDLLRPLIGVAEGNYADAVAQLENLRGRDRVTDALVMQDLAVCLLYSGHIAHAKEMLEDLIEQGHAFSSLLFNLATIFELLTERSRNLKMGLTETLAKRDDVLEGWEKSNADLKL